VLEVWRCGWRPKNCNVT